jgi:FMN phosphatase YigB (HAD superfamily)
MRIQRIIVLMGVLFLFSRIWHHLRTFDVKTAPEQKLLLSSDKKNITFLWDLHGVVFDRLIKEWLSLAWHYDRKGDLIKNLNFNTINVAARYILRGLGLTRTDISSTELLFYADQAHNTALIDFVLLIAQAQHPIPGTVAIIKELAQHGYNQDVGSNIGNAACDLLVKKFPDIFSQFRHYQVVTFENNILSPKKPDPAFFTTYMEKYHIPPSNIIFIDDKAENVASAQSVGIIGLVFTSPDQLHADLATLGIFNSMTAEEKIAFAEQI